jgi:hypothetical protein
MVYWFTETIRPLAAKAVAKCWPGSTHYRIYDFPGAAVPAVAICIWWPGGGNGCRKYAAADIVYSQTGLEVAGVAQESKDGNDHRAVVLGAGANYTAGPVSLYALYVDSTRGAGAVTLKRSRRISGQDSKLLRKWTDFGWSQ